MSPGADPLAAVEQALSGRTTRRRPLAPYSAFKVGGAADLFVEPETTDELIRVLRVAGEEGLPLTVIGGGTNLLIRDGGVRGVVVRMGRAFRTVQVDGQTVTAGAVAPMSKLALEAERAALAGVEFGYDIPGTVGGALRMNAGAHGSEISKVLAEARGVDAQGVLHAVPASEVRFAYRTAVYPVDLVVFTEGVFRLTPGDREELAARRIRNHEYRLETQPKGNTVGSVFVNPPGDYAGRLVEAVGLKGHRLGGARISDKHANWILNDGQATAQDIEGLIRTAQERVREQFGIELKTEVRIVGEPVAVGGGRR